MWIERIHLRDWKSYADAQFEFPQPSKSKPIVLIGAQNGAGKTSLLEGLMFCLYGKKAMHVIAARGQSMARDEQGFRAFLKRALNKGALGRSLPHCFLSVTLCDSDTRYRIDRKYYFARDGHYKDEEVTLYKGHVRDEPEEVAPYSDFAPSEDLRDATSEFIAQKLLPYSIAPFFFFDGEQIQRLGARDQSDAVKEGIEELIGLRLVQKLQEDLDFVGKRRRGLIREPSRPGRAKELEGRKLDLEADITQVRQEIQIVCDLEPSLLERRNRATSDLSLLVNSSKDLEEIIADLYKWQRERERLSSDIRKRLLSRDMGIALAASIIQPLVKRLDAEQQDRDRMRGVKAYREDLAAIVNICAEMEEPAIQPPLSGVQWDGVRGRLERAFSATVAAGSALSDSPRHGYLGESECVHIRSRFAEVQGLSLREIRDLCDANEHAKRRVKQLDHDKAALSSDGAAARVKADLEAAIQAYEENRARQQTLSARLTTLTADLNNVAAEIGRVGEQSARHESDRNIAARCETIRSMLGKYREALCELRYQQLSESMTRWYRQLARKEDVIHRIEVQAGGEVVLYGRDNQVVRDQDFSAGESEVFALSLVAALAEISNCGAPVVIDTPVARLDNAHRSNIAKHYLPKAAEQIILLSTDTELVGPYLESIRKHVKRAFTIEFENSAQISHVLEDQYFGELLQ